MHRSKVFSVLRLILSIVYICIGCIVFPLAGLSAIGYTEGASLGLGVLLAGIAAFSGVLSIKAASQSLQAKTRTFVPQNPLSSFFLVSSSILTLLVSISSLVTLYTFSEISNDEVLAQNILIAIVSFIYFYVFFVDFIFGIRSFVREFVTYIKRKSN